MSRRRSFSAAASSSSAAASAAAAAGHGAGAGGRTAQTPSPLPLRSFFSPAERPAGEPPPAKTLPCPGCGQAVPPLRLNRHLDTECRSRTPLARVAAVDWLPASIEPRVSAPEAQPAAQAKPSSASRPPLPHDEDPAHADGAISRHSDAIQDSNSAANMIAGGASASPLSGEAGWPSRPSRLLTGGAAVAWDSQALADAAEPQEEADRLDDSADSPELRASSPGVDDDATAGKGCFLCGQPDHFARQCPQVRIHSQL